MPERQREGIAKGRAPGDKDKPSTSRALGVAGILKEARGGSGAYAIGETCIHQILAESRKQTQVAKAS